jgi:hypothetical protein
VTPSKPAGETFVFPMIPAFTSFPASEIVLSAASITLSSPSVQADLRRRLPRQRPALTNSISALEMALRRDTYGQVFQRRSFA